MEKDKDLESWRIFTLVAERGSLSGACEAADMDVSAVSRTMRRLEEALGGVALFDRSMRPLRLTANGETALHYARRMLEAHAALLASIETDPLAMKGTIHAGFPPLLLQTFLLPFLIDFQRDYPEISLKVTEYAGSTPVSFDTPRGRLDLVCGYGADATHPNIVQIHYGNGVMIPCASPLYIGRHGLPRDPSELSAHTGIVFDGPMRPCVRSLTKDGRTEMLHWAREMNFESAAAAMSATLCGAGIFPGVAALHCHKHLLAGELTPVLPGWRGPESPLYIYVRTETARLRRVQVFIERTAPTWTASTRTARRRCAPGTGTCTCAWRGMSLPVEGGGCPVA